MFLLPQELSKLPSSLAEKFSALQQIADNDFVIARKLCDELLEEELVKSDLRLKVVALVYNTYLLNKDMQYKHCLGICEEAIQLATQQKLLREKCFLLFNKTTALGFTQQTEGALTLSNQNIIAVENLGDDLKCLVYYRHGYLLYFLNDLKGAVQSLFTAEKAADIAGNVFLQANCCSLLGAVFGNMSEAERGLEFNKKAHTLFVKNGMPEGDPGNLNNIGDNLSKLNRYEEAHEYFLRSYELAKSQSVLQKQIYPLMNMTALFLREEKFAESEAILKTARDVSSQIENKTFFYSTLKLESELLLAKKEFANCSAHIENILAQNLPFDLAHLSQLHHTAYKCYKELNETENALQHFEKFHALDHQLLEEARNKSMQQMTVLHEVEIIKKEKLASEEVTQLKSRFLANMSHEIRTPMNAVMGITNILLMLNPRADQLAHLEAIRKSSENLLTVLNDILDFSKIEKGKIELEQIDFSLEEILEEVNHVIGFKAEEKGLQFSIQTENISTDILKGDPVRLFQVLNNICGNAVKFTQQGEVKVEVSQEKISDEQLQLQLKISDTGIGIDGKNLADIFSEFTQAGTSTSRLFGGTGLGLSISKQLVEMHGGKISVASKLNEGTQFLISIPYSIGSANTYEKQLRERKVFDKNVLNDLKILVVDDNALNLTVSTETLRLLNVSVKNETAENGKEALEKISANNYQLILMDGQMPVMNGLEALKILRASTDEKIKNIPLIAFTASVLKSEVSEWLTAGADDVLAKPFRIQQLVQSIAKVMRREQQQNFSSSKNKIAFSFPRILELCFGDEKRAEEMLQNVQSTYNEHCKLLQICFDGKNISEATRQLHSLQTVLHYLHRDAVSTEIKNAELFLKQSDVSLEKQSQTLRDIISLLIPK